ncbi:YibE/F family protein [Priestia flexa]|uniref:YibE/F family protein n=1 Tax=Priestia flexa TaxID=86664 RepID=UPI001FFB3FE7|nr:YibE/F family protein [Priestia flexa]
MDVASILKKITVKRFVLYAILLLAFLASMVFVNNNYSLYDQPIAEIVKIDIKDTNKLVDVNDNEDRLTNQEITAVLKNGGDKGKTIYLANSYSLSKAYDYEYKVGQKVFVSINNDNMANEGLTGDIKEFKRDTHMVIITWVFIFILIIIGKKQGFLSIVSLVAIAILLSLALDIYISNPKISLILICALGAILFTSIALFLVNGFNEKTFSAIIATLLATFSSLLITCLVIWISNDNGLRYEEMQFLTRPYKMVFIAGLFIGALGAVMDVAVTISSSMFSLYEQNNNISLKALKESGREIGKDIMGTMTNILFFAYISGSIPILILYLKNNSPLGFTFAMNLSLELTRALAGGIGIVLAIPIGIYTTLFFIRRKRARL